MLFHMTCLFLTLQSADFGKTLALGQVHAFAPANTTLAREVANGIRNSHQLEIFQKAASHILTEEVQRIALHLIPNVESESRREEIMCELRSTNPLDGLRAMCLQQDSCSICMESFGESAEVCSRVCGHNFHSSCIQSWIEGNHANSQHCPLCQRLDRRDAPRSEDIIIPEILPYVRGLLDFDLGYKGKLLAHANTIEDEDIRDLASSVVDNLHYPLHVDEYLDILRNANGQSREEVEEAFAILLSKLLNL